MPSPAAVTRKAILVAVLLAVALGLRIGEIEGTSYRPLYDAGSYLSLASQIAHTGSYSNARNKPAAGGTVGGTAYFPPGFPYYLAAVDQISGHLERRGPSVAPARISQAVLGTVLVGLVGLVAFECLGSTVALVALGLAAIYPVLIELSGLLVAENLLSALTLAAIWTVMRARRATGRPRRLGWVVLGGLFTGLASLTHFNGVLLLLPAAFAVWRWPSRRALRALIEPVVLVLATALTIVPWTIRNAAVLHRFIPVSDEAGMTLVGTYNSASAQFAAVPYKWRFFAAIPGEHPLMRAAHHMHEPQLESRLQDQALNYISAHPWAVLNVGWHNLLRLFEFEGSYAWHASAVAVDLPIGTAQVGVICFWVMAGLALLGACVPAARRAPRWLWAVPILLALSVVFVNVETPRFRAPIEPFLVMLAACALVTVARQVAHRLGIPVPSRQLIWLDPVPPPVPKVAAGRSSAGTQRPGTRRAGTPR